MSDEPRDTGIPTRAIHESYLSLQRAHREFRQARDAGGDVQQQQGAFQDAVLTFYELVRPHLKHETSLEKYWAGELPDYTGWSFDSQREAAQYVREHGTGVYQVQQHTGTAELDEQAVTDGGLESFDSWHDYLGLSWDTERLVAVQPAEQQAIYQVLRCAVLPLSELDHWRTEVRQQRQSGDGFMSGETTTTTTREYQPAIKLVAAKRLLIEAVDKLNLLSSVDASTQQTEITKQDLKKVEEWRQQNQN